jgi:hypothetical protein
MEKDDLIKYISYAIGLFILYSFAIDMTTKSQFVKCVGKMYEAYYITETGNHVEGKDEALNREMSYSKNFEVKEKFFGHSYDLDFYVGCKKLGSSSISCGNNDCFMADGYPKEERAGKCKTDNWVYAQFNLDDGHYSNYRRSKFDEKKYSLAQETLECKKAEKILED